MTEFLPKLVNCVLCNVIAKPDQIKLMPCLHTVCVNCVKVSTGGQILCCACGQIHVTDDITDHFIVHSLYLKSLKNQSPKCSSCFDLNESPDVNVFAKYTCLDCPSGENLCSECASAHRRVKQTRNHCLKEIDTVLSTDSLVTKCAAHSNELLCLHCVTCDKVTCKICQLYEHNGHRHQPIERFVASAHSAIGDSLKIVDKIGVRCKRLISKTDQKIMDFETEQDELIKRLNKETDELKLAIDRRSDHLKRKIEKFYKEQISQYLERKRSAETLKILANQTSLFAQAALKCNDWEAVEKGRKLCDSSAERIINSYSAETAELPTVELSLKFTTGKVLNEINRFGELVHSEEENKTKCVSLKAKNIQDTKRESNSSPVYVGGSAFSKITVTMSHDLWQQISRLSSLMDNEPLTNLIKDLKMTRPSEDGLWFITGDLEILKRFEDAVKIVLGFKENRRRRPIISSVDTSISQNVPSCTSKHTNESCSTSQPLVSQMSRLPEILLKKAKEVFVSDNKIVQKSKISAKSEEENCCPICLNEFVDDAQESSETKQLPICKHKFHKLCVELWLKKKASCPVCQKRYGLAKGNQPPGTISIANYYESVPGFVDSNGSIVIQYDIPDGIQGPDHPNPGKPFTGTSRTAFLPNNSRGRKIADFLSVAFRYGLIFTVGTSMTTGASNTVVWTNIPHKTSLKPGPYGYPDEKYLDRVEEQLRVVGISENELVLP